VTLAERFALYMFIAGGLQGNAVPAAERARLVELVRSGATTDPYALGIAASHYDYTMKDYQRLTQRAAWQHYFQSFDAFLAPVHFIPAFPHDQRLPRSERTLPTGRGPRPYQHNMHWISPASLTGLPATAAPVGLTASGLPVGVQIIGPYYEDGTPIDLARKFAEVLGGFRAPPAFSN
jgi:amidase